MRNEHNIPGIIKYPSWQMTAANPKTIYAKQMGKGDGVMLFQESETVEWKEAVEDDIKKEIIAFANCDGGKLYIGIRDDGTVAGLDNPDGISLQISNMVRDAFKPDVTMF